MIWHRRWFLALHNHFQILSLTKFVKRFFSFASQHHHLQTNENENKTLKKMNPVNYINDSALHIASGDYDKAIDTLTESLSSLKQALEEASDELRPSLSSGGNMDLEFLEVPNCPSSFVVHADEKGGDNNDDNNIMFVYQNPIVARWTIISIDHYDQLSYAAMYNLALAYHLKYVDDDGDNNKDKSYLVKARCLYEYSHSALVNQNVGVPPIHLVALTNNLGHCNARLGNHEKADACLNHLLTTLMYLVERGDSNILGKSLDGFITMAYTVIAKSNPAPAA